MCPALKDGTTQKCNTEWPYVEVRRLAVLTQEEQRYFEEAMAVLAAAVYCEHKTVCILCNMHQKHTKFIVPLKEGFATIVLVQIFVSIFGETIVNLCSL